MPIPSASEVRWAASERIAIELEKIPPAISTVTKMRVRIVTWISLFRAFRLFSC